MTDNHPTTPSPELVQQWVAESWHVQPRELRVAASDIHIAAQAARWGSDQELEACLLWVGDGRRENLSQVIALRAARRPKPPSLREQALAALGRLNSGALCANPVTDKETIRRALEQLDD